MIYKETREEDKMRDISRYTQNYLNDDFEKYQVIYRRKKVLEILGRYSHRRILEIGCGMEPLFNFINEDEYEKYVVVEPSKVFFENANLLAAYRNKVQCINEFFEYSVALREQNFDCIICSGLLHEIENQSEFLKNILLLCDKKTNVHINVPNANSFHRLLAKQMGIIEDVHELSQKNYKYQHNNVFDLQQLEELVQSIGFTVVEQGSYFVKPFTHEQMHRMMKENIIDDRVLDGLYGMEKYLKNFGSEIYVNLRKNSN